MQRFFSVRHSSILASVVPAVWVLSLAGTVSSCDSRETGPPGPPDGLACDQGDAFAGLDFVGMWHFKLVFPDWPSASFTTLRVSSGPAGSTALAGGREPTALVLDQSGMFIEVVTDTTADGGSVVTRTYRICSLEADSAVAGTYQFCRDDECVTAALSGRKLLPLDEPVADGVTLIGEYNGEGGQWRDASLTLNVRVRGDVAYVARRFDGLRIVDISDLARPVELGHAPVSVEGSELYNDLKIATGPDGAIYALMASNVRGVVVIDVTRPEQPVEVASFPGAEDAPDGRPSVHTLFVDGTTGGGGGGGGGRAYVSFNDSESLHIYDIADPGAPVLLGEYRNPRMDTDFAGTLHDLYVASGVAYLNYWGLGMTIVDVADPAAPVLLGEFRDYGELASHSNWVTQVGGRTVSVHGDEGYNAHVRIVDVDPASAEFATMLGSYQTRPEVSAHNILAHGERAYVTYYQDGLRILDLSDPYNPRKVAHYHTWPGLAPGYGEGFFEGAIGVDHDPTTGLIYLADTHRGLLILIED